MTMFPAEDDAGDERLPGPDADPASSGEATATLPEVDPASPGDATTTLPDAEPPPSAAAVAAPRKPAPSTFGDAFAALHDDGPQRHGAALRYSVELLAYYYAAQGRQNPAQEAIRTLVTDRYDILDTPRFGLYAPKGQGAAVTDAGLRIMDALNADSVADPIWTSGAADSTEAQRRADYADQARRGRWVMDITGRHAILRDAQGRSVLAGSNISRVRLKGVPVVGFVMEQADRVQAVGNAMAGRAGSVTVEDRPIDVAPVTARPLASESQEPSDESDQATRDSPENQQVVQYPNPAPPPLNGGRAVLKPGLATEENIRALATTLAAESSDHHPLDTRAAVGWTVLNRMIRNGTDDVKSIVDGGAYSRAKPIPSEKVLELARKLLSGEIPDNSNGATHFYSPRSMPREGEAAKGDVRGGLELTPGLSKRNYRPGWALEYEVRSVPGTEQSQFRFFRQPGNGKVY